MSYKSLAIGHKTNAASDFVFITLLLLFLIIHSLISFTLLALNCTTHFKYVTIIHDFEYMCFFTRHFNNGHVVIGNILVSNEVSQRRK